MPEHLRPIASKSRLDADVGEGGMMLAGTGIAEVSLPVAFKLKNIEETEAARRDFEARRAAGLPVNGPLDNELLAGLGQARALTGSMTANYALHRREFAEKLSGRTFGGADSSRSAGAPIVEAGLPVLSKNYKGVTLSGGEPAASDAAGTGAGGDEGAVAAAAAAAQPMPSSSSSSAAAALKQGDNGSSSSSSSGANAGFGGGRGGRGGRGGPGGRSCADVQR